MTFLKKPLYTAIILLMFLLSIQMTQGEAMSSDKYKPLNENEKRVMLNKGTEAPYSGDLLHEKRQCIVLL